MADRGVFINCSTEVEKTIASLIRRRLGKHGLSVFPDKQELRVGDSLTPAIKSAICSASVRIALFSKKYAESGACLNELLWMVEPQCNKIIPIFYDIKQSDLRHVDKGEYAGAFQNHREKGVAIEKVNRWIDALSAVSCISGVVFSTVEDDHGERLNEIVETVLEKVGREQLDVGKYPVGLDQAAENFEKEVLNRGINVVGIVGPAGSGKSTLATHLYNSRYSQFKRRCFLCDVSKRGLPSLQQNLLKDLVLDQNLSIEDTRKGRVILQHRLRELAGVLIVFDGVDNQEQIDNLLFVKDIVGNDSLILVTSRDHDLLVRSKVEIYKVKLLDPKHAQELFCWHAFEQPKPLQGLEDVVEELVRMRGGLPSDLEVSARQLCNERDPRKWKQHLGSLRKQRPKNWWRGFWVDRKPAAFDPFRAL